MKLRSVLSIGLASAAVFCACSKQPAAPGSATPAPTTAVTALGRLEPGLGVVELGAPPGDRIAELTVREGDAVREGQVLAVLDSREVRLAELEAARAAKIEAEEALRRARRVGPVTVETRQADVARLEADLRLASSDLERTQALVEEQVLPARELDFQRSVAEQARARLDQGRRRLEQIRRSSKLEIRAAKAALARAEAEIRSAEKRLERTDIRSPIDGVVLDLRRLEGQPTAGGSILTLGELEAMMAVAEVFETDARLVEAGQRATITSPALPAPLEGTVETMGRLVRRNDVLSLDPAARTDVRVIEARIRLDEPERAAHFVHLQVDVRIELGDDKQSSGGQSSDGRSGGLPGGV